MLKFLRRTLALGLLSAMLPAGAALALDKPVTIAEQGSFLAGGSVKQTAGAFDYGKHASPAAARPGNPPLLKAFPPLLWISCGSAISVWATGPTFSPACRCRRIKERWNSSSAK